MNTLQKKIIALFLALGLALGMVGALFFITQKVREDRRPVLILRNFNDLGGFNFQIYQVQSALQFCEKSKAKYRLVVLFDSGLYKEDRPHFVKDNPYYNKIDWFSYYFEPINQTNKPLSYWKKWVDEHPDIEGVVGADIDKKEMANSVKVFNFNSYQSLGQEIRSVKEFPRIWRRYFILRPHVQKMVDNFKQKNHFSKKYKIGIQYRGTDKFHFKSSHEDYPQHPPYAFCAALVKKVIQTNQYPPHEVVVFGASDEQSFINYMKKQGVNFVCTDAIRSTLNTSGEDQDFSQCEQFTYNGTAESKRYNRLVKESVHLGMKEKSGYIKGLDVLLDVILLGSCDMLIKSRGSVGNQAFWIQDINGASKICKGAGVIDLASEFNAYKKKSKSGKNWKTIYQN